MAEQRTVPYESKSVAEITQGAQGAGGARNRFRISRGLLTLLFVILAALYFIPFYWMFISALRNPDRIFADAGVFYPTALNFSNYLRLFQERPFLQWFGNS